MNASRAGEIADLVTDLCDRLGRPATRPEVLQVTREQGWSDMRAGRALSIAIHDVGTLTVIRGCVWPTLAPEPGVGLTSPRCHTPQRRNVTAPRERTSA